MRHENGARPWFGRVLARFMVATGCMTLLLLAMPWLVVIGLILLIVPGLVMMAIPSVFLWTALFGTAYFGLRNRMSDGMAILTGLLFMAAVVVGLPMLASMGPRLTFAGLNEPELVPSAPVTLAGHVRVDQPKSMSRRNTIDKGDRRFDPGQRCGELCAALLFTDGVASVTIADQEGADRFRLRPAGQCRVSIALPATSRFPSQLATLWVARLAKGQCVERVATDGARPDVAIAISDDSKFHSKGGLFGSKDIRAQAIEIRRGERLLVRRAAVLVDHLAMPLHIAFGGPKENMKFEWGRSHYKLGDRPYEFEPLELIGKHSNLASRVSTAESRAAARALIGAALDRPEQPLPSGLKATVAAYFDSFPPRMNARPGEEVMAEDLALVGRMIGDSRFSDFGGLYYLLERWGQGSQSLRAVTGRRLLDGSIDRSVEDLRDLDQVYRFLPDGALDTPSQDERRLLADPVRRGLAPSLIGALDRGGAASVPQLVAILRTARQSITQLRTSDGNRYARDIDERAANAAEAALRRMGPVAASALPAIEAMVNEELYSKYERESRDFHLLLARLGKPVESIAKPPNLSGDAASFHRNLRERLARYDPKQDR